MSLIECKIGPTSTPVGQEVYTFSPDQYGRAVCNVPNLRHRAILLGLDAYQEVEADIDDEQGGESLPDPTLIAKLSQAQQEISTLETLLEEAGKDGSGGAGSQDQPSQFDRLQRIAGLGDASARKLASRDITTFAQLAALTDEQLAKLDAELDLGGSAVRNQWHVQAQTIVQESSQA